MRSAWSMAKCKFEGYSCTWIQILTMTQVGLSWLGERCAIYCSQLFALQFWTVGHVWWAIEHCLQGQGGILVNGFQSLICWDQIHHILSWIDCVALSNFCILLYTSSAASSATGFRNLYNMNSTVGLIHIPEPYKYSIVSSLTLFCLVCSSI